ncbi:hypothetical protein CCHOA_03245 [Corynebacterium choanae]|uniref:Uncharacterized protein n=1 Tax=Corynebacterium choanae TaxID=1862358 RepID=A0A3G6J4P6_9CORY|nr:hypothetical protein CCHOA_03245 [Corynebacterium choanae]
MADLVSRMAAGLWSLKNPYENCSTPSNTACGTILTITCCSRQPRQQPVTMVSAFSTSAPDCCSAPCPGTPSNSCCRYHPEQIPSATLAPRRRNDAPTVEGDLAAFQRIFQTTRGVRVLPAHPGLLLCDLFAIGETRHRNHLYIRDRQRDTDNCHRLCAGSGEMPQSQPHTTTQKPDHISD